MSFYEDTIQNCSVFLTGNPGVGAFFRCDEDIFSTGFLYEYRENGLILVMDLTVENGVETGVRLVAHTGIQADRNALNYVIRWCQMYSVPEEPGLLVVSPERYIDYVIYAPNEDGPVSGRTLEWLNSCAHGKIAASYGILKMLASGRLDFRHVSGHEWRRMKPAEFPEDSLRAAKTCLANGYKDMKQHMICRNPDDDGRVLYFNRLTGSGDVFYERITVDHSGCLILSIRPERRFQDDELERLSVICNQINSEDRFSGLHSFSEDGYLWFCSPVSLWDEISFETISFLELLAVCRLFECLERWESLDPANRGSERSIPVGSVLPEKDDFGEPDDDEDEESGYTGISPECWDDEELRRLLGPDQSAEDCSPVPTGKYSANGMESNRPLLSEDAIDLDDSIYVRPADLPSEAGEEPTLPTDGTSRQIEPVGESDISGLLEQHKEFLKRNREREERAKELWRSRNGEED